MGAAQWIMMDVANGVGPLCSSDLLSNQRYETLRGELLRQGSEAKADRRLRLDDHISILFENRFMVWLQIQEEKRWLTNPSPEHVSTILERNNVLVAKPGELRASLFLDSRDQETVEHYATSLTIDEIQLKLRLGGWVMEAQSLESERLFIEGVNYIVFFQGERCSTEAEFIEWAPDGVQERILPTAMSEVLRAEMRRAMVGVSMPVLEGWTGKGRALPNFVSEPHGRTSAGS